MTKETIVIAVDGPAGSGKSSICQTACRKMGWTYINTGLYYRAFAYLAKIEEIDINNEEKVVNSIEKNKSLVNWDHKLEKVFFNDKDISSFMRTEKTSQYASTIAKFAKVRKILLPLQQQSVSHCNYELAILDGRDIASTVFPNAHLKIFMTASIEARAERRLKQLQQITSNDAVPDLKQIIKEMKIRDERDSGRSAAPLTQVEDAIFFDTSHLNQDDCTENSSA